MGETNTYPVKCDSIIYDLGNEADSIILSFLSDTVEYMEFCFLISNADENSYTFSFSEQSSSCVYNKSRAVAQKSNTYLKIDGKYIPVLADENEFFSNDSTLVCKKMLHNNFAYLKLNATREVLDYGVVRQR